MHRSQVSLIIGDERLYNDLVRPLSIEKKLMPLIVKLLGCYFYNDEIRGLVEGVSVDDMKERQDFVSDENRELQEMLQDMRASVQLFGMFIADTNATLEEGMEMVSSFASQTGGSSPDTSERQVSVPRISVKGMEKIRSEASLDKSRETVVCEDPRFDSLQKDMESMKGSVEQILALLQGSSTPVVPKSVSTESVSEVRMDTTPKTTTSEPISESQPTPVLEPSGEDCEAGRNRLKAMLQGGGIGGFS